MRTVTIRKKGAGDEWSSVGEEVVTERPSITVGFKDLRRARQDLLGEIFSTREDVRAKETTISSTSHPSNLTRRIQCADACSG